MDKSKLLFNEAYLENQGWYPADIEKQWMSEEDYNEAVRKYNEAEKEILYSNLILHWDSCDCGDGYGCSHGSWVYEITNDLKQKIEFYDDGFAITGERTTVSVENYSIITFQEFEQMCAIAGFKLEHKNVEA